MNWKRLNPTSVLRVLPALFVGLIPFTTFDQSLLRVEYQLRGQVEPLDENKVFVGQSRDELLRLVELTKKMNLSRCIVIGQEKVGAGGCEFIDLNGRFTLDAVKEASANVPFPGGERADGADAGIFFYGPLASFNPIDGQIVLAKRKSFREGTEAVVILDGTLGPRIPVVTPIGTISQVEVALNIAMGRIENKKFRVIPPLAQWLVAVAMTLGTAVLLYSYPTVMTFIIAVVLGALEFAIAFMLFDSFGWHVPVYASWASMLTVGMLGMGDRLDRRERREWDFEQESQNLKTLDEMRNNFLSLVSHDLKTPIAKILSMLDRFARGEFGAVTPQQRETLDRIVSASGYLQRTISTLLLLSRIESRDFALQRTPTDLTELLETSIKQQNPLALERNIRLEKELEPLFLVDLDRDLILQVVNNVIDNALKYSPPNCTISVRSGELENCTQLSPPQPAVWLEVQDEGPGITAEDREKVLQKFVRGSSESTAADQSVKGTGLGLYLSQFFVEKHGGKLTLVSKTAEEALEPDGPASEYFSEGHSGTVVLIFLPIDPPIIES